MIQVNCDFLTIIPSPDIVKRLEKSNIRFPKDLTERIVFSKEKEVDVHILHVQSFGTLTNDLEIVHPVHFTKELIKQTEYRPLDTHVFLEVLLLNYQNKLTHYYADIFCLPDNNNIEDKHLIYESALNISYWTNSVFRYWQWIIPLTKTIN